MKKVASILLLFIFLFNTIGYFIAFKAFQFHLKSEIKKEIKNGLSNEQLTIIHFDKNNLCDIEWMKKGKEFCHKGKLYDIVKIKETQSTITYYCINDSQEKTLFANLEEHINIHISNNKPLKNSLPQKLVENVIKVYFSNTYVFSFNHHSNTLIFHPYTTLHYTSNAIETNHLPPEFYTFS